MHVEYISTYVENNIHILFNRFLHEKIMFLMFKKTEPLARFRTFPGFFSIFYDSGCHIIFYRIAQKHIRARKEKNDVLQNQLRKVKLYFS